MDITLKKLPPTRDSPATQAKRSEALRADSRLMTVLIDTHSHLHFSPFNQDQDEVHARMAKFGIKTITIGTAITTSRSAIEYADKYLDTWASVGYHPEHITSNYEDEIEKGALDEPYNFEELKKLAQSSSRVLAIGETGLDYHYFEKDPNLDIEKAKSDQLEIFNQHIQIAAEFDKALIVHSRNAGDDILKAIQIARQKHPKLRVVIHGFSDTWQQAQAFLDLGCYLGIGGIVTFKPRKNTLPQDTLSYIAANMELSRLLIETDCPWLAPVPVRGERNEPSNVRYIAEFIANLRNISFAEFCDITTQNAQKCFNCEFR